MLSRLLRYTERRSRWTQGGPPRDPALAAFFGACENTAAGIHVNADNATRVIAVFACVKLLAEAIASLPFGMVKLNADGSREAAPGHWLHQVIHRRPNRFQTSFEWREMAVGHLCLRGNHYSEIIGNGMRPVTELVPLHPDRVRPVLRDNGEVAYEHAPLRGPQRTLLAREVLHLRGFSSDGLVGLCPINEAREALGVARAAEEFGGRFFGNGTHVGSTLEHPGKLGDKAYENLKNTLEDRHQGPAKSHRVMILEEGMKWAQLGVEPEKAQFLETRKFQVVEIARLFGIPPFMIGESEKNSSWGSGIEQQQIGFVVRVLRSLCERIEQRCDYSLIPIVGEDEDEDDAPPGDFECKFNLEGQLRGDSQTRARVYKEYWSMGVMSPNEIRAKENLKPREGGDSYYVPSNHAPADAPPADDPAPEPNSDEDDENDMDRRALDIIERLALSASGG